MVPHSNKCVVHTLHLTNDRMIGNVCHGPTYIDSIHYRCNICMYTHMYGIATV